MILTIARRLDVDARQVFRAKLIALVVAFGVAGVLLLLTGREPIELAGNAMRSTFAERRGIEELLVLATPITLLALSVSIGFMSNVWNVGTEGQFFMGAWAAAGVGIHADLPDPVLLLLMAVVACVAGMAWVLVPALLRAYMGVNEIITTLLMSFVATQWVVWFATDIWSDPLATVQRASYPVEARLPLLFDSPRLHAGVLVPAAMAVLLTVLADRSRFGFEARLIGQGAGGAKYAGIPVERRTVEVMLLSGAVAGLAGMIQLSGTNLRLATSLSNQYGLSGLMIAAVAGGSFLAVLGFGLLIATVFRAGLTLQTQGLNTFVVFALYGLILAFLAVAEAMSRFRVTVATRGRSSGRSSEEIA